jgi:hypothetical protein
MRRVARLCDPVAEAARYRVAWFRNGAGRSAVWRQGWPRPIHDILLPIMGTQLVDNGYYEDVAKEASRLKRWSSCCRIRCCAFLAGRRRHSQRSRPSNCVTLESGCPDSSASAFLPAILQTYLAPRAQALTKRVPNDAKDSRCWMCRGSLGDGRCPDSNGTGSADSAGRANGVRRELRIVSRQRRPRRRRAAAGAVQIHRGGIPGARERRLGSQMPPFAPRT